MMTKNQSRALLLLAAFILTVSPVFACAIGIETIFDYSTHPDLPLKPFAGGELGILKPSYARSYLIPAYRYLSGNPLSSSEQQAMLWLWDARLSTNWVDYSADTSAWLAARKLVPGAPKLESLVTTRMLPDASWQEYCNCQTPAFQTAAATLKDRIARYGADSPAVKDWLKAQDTVFSNCSGPAFDQKEKPPAVPEPLPATASLEQRQDRDYQIAAADFYAQQWPQAIKQFDAIAQDKQSPWSQIAGYLSVRAMIRQATVQKSNDMSLLAAADEKVKSLIADPRFAGLLPDLEQLHSYTAARLDAGKHVDELAGRLNQKITLADATELTKTLDLMVGGEDAYDVSLPSYAEIPEALKKPDMVDWMLTFQSTDEAAKKHALQKWQQTHSHAWLLAALLKLQSSDPEAAALLEAAAAVPRSSACYWSVFNKLVLLKQQAGDTTAARASLDKVLSAPQADLPLSALNALNILRFRLAKDLNEFVRFGILHPACNCTTGGVEEVPDDVDAIEKSGKAPANAPVFTEDAGYLMDLKLPVNILLQLAQDKNIPSDLRGHIAWCAWVRAVLINDEASALKLAAILKDFNKAKLPLLNNYLAAATPEMRKFAAVFLMLQFSSAVPNPGWGPLSDDAYGDSSGWWWGPKPVADYSTSDMNGKRFEQFEPLFITAQQKTRAQTELAKLAGVQTAPDYFASIVLPFAKAHPGDSRVPAALHYLVKATRYGFTDEATTNYSKEAFQLLHKEYKTSPWTRQTPYWY